MTIKTETVYDDGESIVNCLAIILWNVEIVFVCALVGQNGVALVCFQTNHADDKRYWVLGTFVSPDESAAANNPAMDLINICVGHSQSPELSYHTAA